MIYFSLAALMVLHWSACLFYFAASWRDFDSLTWVYRWDLVPTDENGLANGANYITRWGLVRIKG